MSEQLQEQSTMPLMLADPDMSQVDPQEFGIVAAKMAEAYRRQVDYYKNDYGKSLPEAMEMAAQAPTDALQAAFIAGLREEPADQVSWGDLRNLEDARPGDALRKWEEVKAWAKDELASGQRGAAATEYLSPTQDGPLARARYSVLVQEMAKDWLPLSGVEYILVEQMAQAYTMQLYWTSQYAFYCQFYAAKVSKEYGEVTPPTVTKSQMVADAAGMVDRWNRMFLRCLRQLRDLRRYNVVIHAPAQVNIGEKQINIRENAVSNTQRSNAHRSKINRAKQRRRDHAGPRL